MKYTGLPTVERLKNSYLSGLGASLSLHLVLAGAFAYYTLRESTPPEQVFTISLIHPGELSIQSQEGGSKLVEARSKLPLPVKDLKKVETKNIPPRPLDKLQEVTSSLPAGSVGNPSTGKSLLAKKEGDELGHGDGKAKANYQQIILAKLEEEKRYPRSAKRMQAQGVATLELVLQKNGSLLSSKIVQSSGFRILDSEVVDLASRAAPYPKMPVSLRNTSITLHVPIEFRLMS